MFTAKSFTIQRRKNNYTISPLGGRSCNSVTNTHGIMGRWEERGKGRQGWSRWFEGRKDLPL